MVSFNSRICDIQKFKEKCLCYCAFLRMIFAERKFTGRTLFNLTKKVSIDQFMIGPILMMCFFTYNEGEKNKEV